MKRIERWVLADPAHRRLLSRLLLQSMGQASNERVREIAIRALRHLPWDQAMSTAESLDALSVTWILCAHDLTRNGSHPLHREAGRVFLARVMLEHGSRAQDLFDSLTNPARLAVAKALMAAADEEGTGGYRSA